MSELAQGISEILAQSRTGFQVPAVSFQVDTSQMRSLFEGLCNQFMQMSAEVQGLRQALAQKADQSQIENLSRAFAHETAVNAENFNRINLNAAELKNALVSGLDRCLKDAGALAKDLVADIQIPEPIVVETRPPTPPQPAAPPTPHTVYVPAPFPTADISELTAQVATLRERITAIEQFRPEPQIIYQQVHLPVQPAPSSGAGDFSRPRRDANRAGGHFNDPIVEGGDSRRTEESRPEPPPRPDAPAPPPAQPHAQQPVPSGGPPDAQPVPSAPLPSPSVPGPVPAPSPRVATPSSARPTSVPAPSPPPAAAVPTLGPVSPASVAPPPGRHESQISAPRPVFVHSPSRDDSDRIYELNIRIKQLNDRLDSLESGAAAPVPVVFTRDQVPSVILGGAQAVYPTGQTLILPGAYARPVPQAADPAVVPPAGATVVPDESAAETAAVAAVTVVPSRAVPIPEVVPPGRVAAVVPGEQPIAQPVPVATVVPGGQPIVQPVPIPAVVRSGEVVPIAQPGTVAAVVTGGHPVPAAQQPVLIPGPAAPVVPSGQPIVLPGGPPAGFPPGTQFILPSGTPTGLPAGTQVVLPGLPPAAPRPEKVRVIEKETIVKDLPDDVKESLQQLHGEVKKLWGEVDVIKSQPPPEPIIQQTIVQPERVIERVIEQIITPAPSPAPAPAPPPSPAPEVRLPSAPPAPQQSLRAERPPPYAESRYPRSPAVLPTPPVVAVRGPPTHYGGSPRDVPEAAPAPLPRLPEPPIIIRSDLPPETKAAMQELADRLRDIGDRMNSCEGSMVEFGDFVNDLQRQLQQQQDALRKVDLAAKEGVPGDTKPSGSIDDLLTGPSSPPSARGGDQGERVALPASGRAIDDIEAPAKSVSTIQTPAASPREKPAGSPRPEYSLRPHAGDSLNTDELLDGFMDAARTEIDKARRQVLDEAAANLRAFSTQVNGGFQKSSANVDLLFKKCQAKIQETDTALQSEIKASRNEQSGQVKQLFVNAAEINQRLKTMEQRMDAITQAPKDAAPQLDTIVGADGKIDLEPVLIQLQGLMTVTSDQSSRLRALEEREVVPPGVVAAMKEAMDLHDRKIQGLEVQEVGAEMRLAELREMIEDVKKNQQNPEEDARYQELRDLARSLEDDTVKLRDAMVKVNKDMISCRAAINTLRSHSEDLAASMEDVRRIAESVRDDTTATDKRLKKVVVFVQNETKDLASQIKDIQLAIDRNANRIEEVSTQKRPEEQAAAPAQQDQQAPAPGKASGRVPESAPPPSPIRLQLPTPPVISIATSPHPQPPDAPIEPPPIPQQQLHQQPLPPLAPVPMQPPQIMTSGPPQVVQLPPQIIYEQPVVTVVKKQQIEVDTGVRPGKPLPRLKPTPAPAIGKTGPPEVTRADLKKYDDLFGRLEKCESTFQYMKSAIESLNKTAKVLTDTKADKDTLQTLFDQFRLAMAELNNRVGTLRKAIMQKADVSELQTLRADVTKDIQATGETAAGTETVRCLLCGNPRHNVSGAIPLASDEPPARAFGPGLSTRMYGGDGQGTSCFVYSETGEMFMGRSQDGKPIVMKNVLGPANLPGARPGEAPPAQDAETSDVNA